MQDQFETVHCRRNMSLKNIFFSDYYEIDLSGKQIRKKEFTFFADQIFSKN